MISCLINGQAITSIAVANRAIHYGDGIFETIALKHGIISFWPAHYQRLVAACERLKFPQPQEALLLQEIDEVKQGLDKAVIKIIITRLGERGYRIPNSAQVTRIVQSYVYPEFPKAYQQSGIEVCFCKTGVSENKALAGIKHLNRLDNVLASSEWVDPIVEGLMCNAQEQVIQGTKSNLFCVKDGVLYTPDLSSAGINGIMRAQVLQWAQEQKINTSIETISRDKLLTFDEMFVCNSIFGIWPVTKLDNKRFVIGKITQQLLAYFE